MTPLQILHQLRKVMIDKHAEQPEFDPVMSECLAIEYWLARASGQPLNSFYFPLKCKCGEVATKWDALDQDCGNLGAYEPACEAHDHGDYSFCLQCLGHIDGHGDGCSVGDCTCIKPCSTTS